MKTKIFITASYFLLLQWGYAQDKPDSLAVKNTSIIENPEVSSVIEVPKTWELRGSIRELGRVFSESSNETDLLESRLKLELISASGKKTAFRVMGYAVHQYPAKEFKFDLKEAYIDYYSSDFFTFFRKIF